MKLFVLAALIVPMALGQVVRGIVRTAQGSPVAAATVHLESNPGGPRLTARTNRDGTYRITARRGGTYTCRAEAGGFDAATSGPFSLGDKQSKTVDLILKPLVAEFSDEPNFIVAGVTDTTNHGGHGSDTVRRSSEELTRETAALAGAAATSEDPLAAIRAYQRAAEQDPSEPNLFHWGAELLVHRAAEQAIEVFNKGHRLFPQSVRTLLGLAVAWYSNGSDERAAEYFFAACDVNPDDADPYLFLGKVQSAAITQLPGYLERMSRFARLKPGNAWADYYFAATLWKQRADPDDSKTSAYVQVLLEKALHLDPHLNEAYLLLGVVYSDRRDSARAIDAYQKAEMNEAHYRLAQEYRRTGEAQKADAELAVYKELSAKSAEAALRERLEIKQFVFALRQQK